MKKCPQCTLNLDDNVVVCPNCNFVFTEETVVDPATAYNTIPAQPVANEYQEANQQTPPPPYQQGYNPYGAPQGKYCPRCGNLCDPLAAICVKCGMPFNNVPQQSFDDNPSTGLKILCFFFPIVALILYIVNKDKKPVSAKAYGKMGIIGFAVSMGLSIISSVLTTIFGLSAMDDYYYYYQIMANLF